MKTVTTNDWLPDEAIRSIFIKGTKVKLSEEGAHKLKPENKYRIGVVSANPKNFSGFISVLWEGRKSSSKYAYIFLQRVP